MPTDSRDISIVRDLARQYAEIAAKPIQEERRRLWSAHFALKKTRPLIMTSWGMWNLWCRELFPDSAMKCQDGFWRGYERRFRMLIFHDSIGDDRVMEPWIGVGAANKVPWDAYGGSWGVKVHCDETGAEGGAFKMDPPIKEWSDVITKLTRPVHAIDEEKTAERTQKVGDALGDILPIDVGRGPAISGHSQDISTTLGALRGIEQLMIDMYESPRELHWFLAYLRDGILMNHQEAEDAGDFSLTCSGNQCVPYSDDLEWPKPNSGPRKRKDIWGFCAAQEYTGVSPQCHDEFLFQYQIPIMEKFGLVHYGCCENLTDKIDMLRKLKNLRSIAVTPSANLHKSAERIGKDYCISWRPSPADMVCTSWDESRIRGIVRDGLSSCKDSYLHLHLKDIETLQGEPQRLAKWVQIVRELS